MAKKEILLFENETLRKVSHKVEKFNIRLWLLLRDMADTMYDAEGVGLAAPQIGILRRVVVIDVDDENGLIEFSLRSVNEPMALSNIELLPYQATKGCYLEQRRAPRPRV